MSLIIAENLTKDYGNLRAVDNISFEVKEGEIFGFFGPNGAGKTTTIKLLTGLTKPTFGNAVINGIQIEDFIRVREEISILMELPFLYENMNLLNYLRFYGKMSKLSSHELERKIAEVISIVEMENNAKKKIRIMSMGQRQRAEIARILLSNSRILFLDEPFTMVDVELRKKIRYYLRDYLKDGSSIFYTSHNLIESEYIVDRFAFIVRGKITALGTADDLKKKFLIPIFFVEVNNPKNAYEILSSIEDVRNCEIFENGIRITLKNIESVAKVPKVLVENEIEIYEMRKLGTMEDVFDKLTYDTNSQQIQFFQQVCGICNQEIKDFQTINCECGYVFHQNCAMKFNLCPSCQRRLI